jgi:hypothetical protein
MYSKKLIKGNEKQMFNCKNHFRGSKQVQILATMSYWSAIETLGNDRAPNSICGVRS